MALAHLRLRRDVVRAGVDGVALERPLHAAAQRVDLLDRLDVVAEELDADGRLVLVGREDLDHVAAHAERAAVEVDVVSLVLDVDELAQQRVAPELLAHGELDERGRGSSRRCRCRRCSSTLATMMTSRRESSASVAEWRIRSIWSLMIASFSMNVSVDGTYASGW